jgi:hypothetical protein
VTWFAHRGRPTRAPAQSSATAAGSLHNHRMIPMLVCAVACPSGSAEQRRKMGGECLLQVPAELQEQVQACGQVDHVGLCAGRFGFG